MESLESHGAGLGVVWDAAHAAWRVQVYGAGGARGRALVMALLAAGHPPARLALYGRRARTLTWHGTGLPIEPLPRTPPPAELAFLCLPPKVAPELGPRLAARGTRVIDLVGGGSARPESAMVLAEINGMALGAFTEELVLPQPTTALIARPLALIAGAAGLAEVDLFAIVGAASGGAAGILSLRQELCALAERGGAPGRTDGARIGNLRSSESIHPGFEAELARELKTLLGEPELLLDVQALAGDLERCDLFAVKLLLHSPLPPEEARELLGGAEGLQLVEEPGPSPAAYAGRSAIHVGRIRSGSRGPRSLCFQVAGDQLVAGSSIAALRVASRFPAG